MALSPSPSAKTLGDLYLELQELDFQVIELRDGAKARRKSKLREIHFREHGYA